MESIIIVELDLESRLVLLGPVEKRFGTVLLRFSRFSAVFGTFEGEGGVYGKREVMESIELVEIYLEPVTVILDPVEKRIRDSITKIFTVLSGI